MGLLPDVDTPPPVIALAASAGGLSAIATVLERLPPTLGAAVVVVLHQSPDRRSHLTELLARRCPLTVSTATHGAPVRRGSVLVVPGGQHALMASDRELGLIVAGEFPPNRPSADLLFATLATACRTRAIAVVLSGNGHDGATGATAVQAYGGTVIAADAATSEVFAMPSATIRRDDAVDHVLPVPDIPAFLTSCVGRLTAAGKGSSRG